MDVEMASRQNGEKMGREVTEHEFCHPIRRTLPGPQLVSFADWRFGPQTNFSQAQKKSPTSHAHNYLKYRQTWLELSYQQISVRSIAKKKNGQFEYNMKKL